MKTSPLKVATLYDQRRYLHLCREGDETSCFQIVREILRTNGSILNNELLKIVLTIPPKSLADNHIHFEDLAEIIAKALYKNKALAKDYKNLQQYTSWELRDYILIMILRSVEVDPRVQAETKKIEEILEKQGFTTEPPQNLHEEIFYLTKAMYRGVGFILHANPKIEIEDKGLSVGPGFMTRFTAFPPAVRKIHNLYPETLCGQDLVKTIHELPSLIIYRQNELKALYRRLGS